MVDSPVKPEGVVTTGIPQSKLSGADIAQPYQMLSRALGDLGQAAEQVAVPLAERAGAQAVTRDDQGNIQVEHMPIFGLGGEAYERAVKVGALAEADGTAQRADIAMRENFRDNPQGYLAAADKFKQDQVAKLTASAGPEVGTAYGRVIDRTTTQTYRGLLNEKERLDLQRADSAITAGINSASDDAVALARQGVALDSPDMQGLLGKYTTLLDEKLKNPRLAYTQEQHDLDLQTFQGQLAGARNLYHVDQVYKTQGYPAAVEAAKDVLTNADYKLSPAQRQAFYSHAMGEIRANEAIRRQDVGEARLAHRELSAAARLGEKITPDDIESVANAYKAAGYPAGVAQLYGEFAHKDLHDDFGRQPLGAQAQELNTIRGAAALTQVTTPSGRSVTVSRQAAPAFEGFLKDLEATGYKINSIGGYNYRNIAGTNVLSNHAFGNAIDINPEENPDTGPGGKLITDLPPNVSAIAAKWGLRWGGDYTSKKDAMHFELAGNQPLGGSGGPGVQSWLIANRTKAVNDNATKAWKEIWTDWSSGKGSVPSNDRVNDVITAARATGNVDLLAKIGSDMDVIDKVQRMSQLPVSEQVALETELRRRQASGTADEGAQLVEKQLTARTKAIQDGLADNPVATAIANFPNKFKTPAPLDLQDPQKLVAGLKMRAQIAQTAAANWQSGPLSALDSQDVAQVKAALANPDPAVKAGIYGAIAQLPEDVRGATLRKLGGNEPQGMAEAAAGSLMATAPAIAASIFRGQAAMKADKRYDPTAENEGKRSYFADLDKVLPAATFTLQDRTDPAGAYATMGSMVRARYADLSARAGDTNYSKDRLQQAVTDVTGGILTHNGGPLVAPVRGMSQAQFDSVILGLTDQDLQGVTTLSGNPVTASNLRSRTFTGGGARLESVGDGKYYVLLGNDPMKPVYAYQGANGELPTKFVLDLRGRSGDANNVLKDLVEKNRVPAYSPSEPVIPGNLGIRG